ncbi:hypothetical protein A1359_14235 [Methylomonas lenta]|uniref:O-antigen polymerase n=1 Tax=Methylomonas lenta TaxID=980561 RepID=A0A177N2V5_9GAMM|nr:hypothetical protein A1359_14235 [Methylomonas lenta]
MAAYFLLPAGLSVDVPLVPPLDKSTIPNIAAYLVCLFIKGKRVPLLPKDQMARWLMLAYVVSPFVTVLGNADPLIAGPTFIKGMELYDALSAVIRQGLFILPFLLGLAFLRAAKDHEDMLMVLAVAGLLYSLPMLLEVRLSPQLHVWIYGYFPHSFLQQMRGDGFRPVVFMGHGLLVAFSTMTSVIAATALWRTGRRVKWHSGGQATAYLMAVLLLCKSMAAFLYAVTLSPLVRYGKPKQQIRVASILVLIAMFYPVLRGLDWFPSQIIYDAASSFSPDRAQSFDFRVRNEDMLLDKANERPLFGWGSWGRNRVYHSESGKDLSVTDGRWVITIGQFGWIGLFAEFGLLALPVLLSARALRYLADRRESIVLGAVALILGINVLDLVPNNPMSPWTWLVAGALLGRYEQLLYIKRTQSASKHHLKYTRPVQDIPAH